jgi:hypothetical protein
MSQRPKSHLITKDISHQFPQGLKPALLTGQGGTAEAVPFQSHLRNDFQLSAQT